jgi:HlyD family secretion protein
MSRKRVVPLLAILGLGVALVAIINHNRPVPVHVPTVEPAAAPYDSFVAGAGLVEASTGNIAIGSPVSGIATEIDVSVGEYVRAGEVLFRIDDRDLQAQLLTATAKATAAEAALLQPRHRLDYGEDLRRRNPDAITDQTLSDLRDEVAIAEANLAVANADVARLRADIRLRTVRAPVAGRVLQLRLRLGEYVDGGAAPVLLFGDDRRLYVRVDVDENDAWRVRPDAPAVAFVRGNPKIKIPLRFEYIEPAIIPKTSLTGRTTERTDVRVLQVLYSFPSGTEPVYVGQQLDVFIQVATAAQHTDSAH